MRGMLLAFLLLALVAAPAAGAWSRPLAVPRSRPVVSATTHGRTASASAAAPGESVLAPANEFSSAGTVPTGGRTS